MSLPFNSTQRWCRRLLSFYSGCEVKDLTSRLPNHGIQVLTEILLPFGSLALVSRYMSPVTYMKSSIPLENKPEAHQVQDHLTDVDADSVFMLHLIMSRHTFSSIRLHINCQSLVAHRGPCITDLCMIMSDNYKYTLYKNVKNRPSKDK
jgi:hypothetical protein